MYAKRIILTGVFLWIVCTLSAQVTIRIGMNMAREDLRVTTGSLPADFKIQSLTGFQAGLLYQGLFYKGLGIETGAIVSQLGVSYSYPMNDEALYLTGYNEMYQVEIPLSLKYVFRIQFFGIYASAGVYGACAFNRKTVLQTDDSKHTYSKFSDRLDWGYTTEAGIELFQKVQIGVNWRQSLMWHDTSTLHLINNDLKGLYKGKVLSIVLGYLF